MYSWIIMRALCVCDKHLEIRVKSLVSQRKWATMAEGRDFPIERHYSILEERGVIGNVSY